MTLGGPFTAALLMILGIPLIVGLIVAASGFGLAEVLMVMLIALLNYITPDALIWGGGLIIVGIPTLFVIQGLFRDVPLPVRFNRQRREVCVPRENGEYWIVPWESVTAAALAEQALPYIAALYEVEREVRDLDRTFDDEYARKKRRL